MMDAFHGIIFVYKTLIFKNDIDSYRTNISILSRYVYNGTVEIVMSHNGFASHWKRPEVDATNATHKTFCEFDQVIRN